MEEKAELEEKVNSLLDILYGCHGCGLMECECDESVDEANLLEENQSLTPSQTLSALVIPPLGSISPPGPLLPHRLAINAEVKTMGQVPILFASVVYHLFRVNHKLLPAAHRHEHHQDHHHRAEGKHDQMSVQGFISGQVRIVIGILPLPSFTHYV